MHLEKVSRGIYNTTSGFNAAAVSAARENNIQLIDGYQLVNLIERLPVEIQDKLVKNVTVGDYTTPTCVQCGIKMVRRKSNDKEFWGCKNFPKCRRTLMG
jgi:restriction system protein